MKKTVKSERNIVFSNSAATESGRHLAEGIFNFKKTDTALTSDGSSTSGHSLGSPMYMLLRHVSYKGGIDLFRFPLIIGNHWKQEGPCKSKAAITLEGYETVKVSAGAFSSCLKHKTVFTDADAEDDDAELRNAFVNGTRYLWFAKGVGLVKMRYEHSNGIVTEAELLEYEMPVDAQEYLPVQIGTQWTYRWQNISRDEATVEEWRVIRNFSEPENLDDPMELASARYEVKIEAAERRVAHVKCVLTPKVSSDLNGDRKPLLLSMSHFGAEDMGGGYGRYLRDLRTTDADGEEIPITEIGETQWMVETENDLPVTLYYKVLLNHDEKEWRVGRPEIPYLQEDCIFLPGYAVFIVAKVDDIELQLDVPENWHVSTSWQCVGSERHRFAITDENNLMSAYLLLGTHSERVARLSKGADGTEIVLAVGGHFKASMDEVQRTVESLLHTYSGVFDGMPQDRMLFVANPDEKRHGGGVSGNSISVLMRGSLSETDRRFWVPLVAHEVCHIWNGKLINFGEQEYWFSEGFTEYYSRVACTRLGLTSENDFLRDIESKWESYLSRQGELSIREAGEDKSTNRELVYQGGSLIAAALDLQIRSLTHVSIDAGQKSLDDVMKQMYQEFGLTENRYTMRDVIRVVNQVVGENFEPFFYKYVSGTERLPLEEYLRDVGIDVEIEFSEKLPNLGYILHEMLQINSFGGPTGGGMFIHESKQYQDDDNLIGVNGTPVKFFDDIRKAAKDWKPGDLVELTLEREGKEIILPITLGGDASKEIPLEAGPIDVTLTKRTDSTDFQRSIWSRMLGNGNHPFQEGANERNN